LKHIFKNTLAILHQQERQRLGVLAILDILISVMDIVFLALLVFIIHFYTQAGAGAASFLPGWLRNDHSLLLITLFLLLFSTKNLFGFLVYRALCRFICRVATRLSRDKLMQYQAGAYAAYINIDSAAHTRKISHEPTEFCQHIMGGLQQIVTQTVLIVLSIVAMIMYNATIFLFLFIILLPPVIAIFYLIKNRLRSMRIHAKTSIEKSLQYLQEAVSGFVESNIYNKNDFFLQRYVSCQQQFNKYLADLLIAQGIPSRMIEVFALLGLFTLVALNKWSGGAGSTTLVTVGAFMAAAYKIIPGIVKILNLGSQVRTYEFTIHDLLPANTAAVAASAAMPATTPAPANTIQAIRFEQVHFSYERQPIVNNLSFTLEPGDLLGISGPSGKGKTTIVNLLLGFLAPAQGHIFINNAPAGAAAGRAWWQRIAYVKQQSFLIHDTLLRNIILDEKTYDEKRLQCALQSTGLAALVASLPGGLDTLVAENGKNISGGQRQRVALARALYKNADLIILDEPFNELDEASEITLLQHFQQLAQAGKMIILITHHRNSLSFCTKTISLDD
jgi:ABC-type bacteriocin/lantibiotic exporter with double-glycine peptidase domain